MATLALALDKNYGSSGLASLLVGLSRSAVYLHKLQYFSEVIFPEKPRDNGVRLDNHKPITDADFFGSTPIGVQMRETELDAT